MPGIATKDAPDADPETGTCVDCGKEFALDDMTDTDDGMVCKACMAKKAAPVKHVVASVPSRAAEPETVRHVHRVLSVAQPTAAAPDIAVKIKRLVVAQIAKARGRIYID